MAKQNNVLARLNNTGKTPEELRPHFIQFLEDIKAYLIDNGEGYICIIARKKSRRKHGAFLRRSVAELCKLEGKRLGMPEATQRYFGVFGMLSAENTEKRIAFIDSLIEAARQGRQ